MTLQHKRRESSLEAKFIASCRRYGGRAHKLGHSGLPDRIVVWDKGVTTYAELKREGEEPEPHQWVEIKALRDRGHLVAVVRNAGDIASFISESLLRVLDRE